MYKNPQYNESDMENHLGIWLWIENKKEEILMLYHKKYNCWTIPLEKSNPNENLEDAIKRAGQEEVGIEINDFEIIHTQTNKYIRDGRPVKVKASLVRVKNFSGIPKNMEPEKALDLCWKTKEFTLQLESPMDAVKVLQKYLLQK
jgi:ADP-ribose pyrophosphatase YjhB (NUDIX family)